MAHKKSTKSSARSTKKKASKKSPKSIGWKRCLFGLFWKTALAFVSLLIVIGLYLYTLIEERFDGQLFDLPTVVYARVQHLEVGSPWTITEVQAELAALNYRKVRSPRYPGEYSASSTKIELIRRPFDFNDGRENARHVMLYFNKTQLQRINLISAKRDLGYLRLDPKMLGMLEKNVSEQRLFVPRSETPEFLIDALLMTEDREFYKHDGVSPTAILRALLVNLKAGRTVQGGSTLTQQLSKNLFLSNERTLWRKVREAYIAMILDYRYDKDRILEAYMNEVYLGQSGNQAIHGFGLAARYYFGQPLQELRIDQLAMLVGMVKGPSYYNPIRYPDRAKKRRDIVLRLMLQRHYLTPNQYETAASRELDLQDTPQVAPRQPAYFQQLANEVKQVMGERFHQHYGLRLFTSLDPRSQLGLEAAIKQQIPTLEKKANSELEVAAMAVDRTSGEIRAMVGGKRTQFDGYNRTLNASRQIGSLVKPAVYLHAWQQPYKYNLLSPIVDEPIAFSGSKGMQWEPKNYDKKYRGVISLYRGLSQSLNVPTVRLGMTLGIKNVQQTLEDLGVGENEVRPLPSMFLGSFTLTPFQVTQMYQSIANSGKRADLSSLRMIVDQDDQLLYQSLPSSYRVVKEQAAWLTTFAMKKTVTEGTARRLRRHFSSFNLAGKTGTTNDGRDSWFVGIDGKEVTTIWVGRDDNKPTSLTGASGALTIYEGYLRQRPPKPLVLAWPSQLITMGYKSLSGGRMQLFCEASSWPTVPIWDPESRYCQ